MDVCADDWWACCRSFFSLIFPILMALSLSAKRLINWAIKSLHHVYPLGCTILKKRLVLKKQWKSAPCPNGPSEHSKHHWLDLFPNYSLRAANRSSAELKEKKHVVLRLAQFVGFLQLGRTTQGLWSQTFKPIHCWSADANTHAF